MNEAELDQLLDAWKAPEPPPSLRAGVRARFPRVERRRFPTWLRWGLVVAAASATLAVGMQQGSGGDNSLLDLIANHLQHLHIAMIRSVESWQASSIRNQVREANPKAYVDGHPAALNYRGGGSMWVDVPGDGSYGMMAAPPFSRQWVKSGRLHNNVLEFQAGAHQVRIICDKRISDGDRALYVTHQP